MLICGPRRLASKMGLAIFYWPWGLSKLFLLVSDSISSLCVEYNGQSFVKGKEACLLTRASERM